MVSKTSASSRNSSLRPGSRIRWDSDPFAAIRAASAIRVSGASIRPARIHPPQENRTPEGRPVLWPRWGRSRAEDDGSGWAGSQVEPLFMAPSGVVRVAGAAQEHPSHGQQESAGEEKEPGVADGEFQPGAEPCASVHEPVSIR